jgi:hypothetical protein
VLRDSRLRKAQGRDQRSDGQGTSPRQQLDNLSPNWLSNGVEYVGCGLRTRHVSYHIPVWEYVKPTSLRP